MSPQRRAALAAVLVALGVRPTGAQTPPSPPPAAEFRDGRWQAVEPTAPVVPLTDPELDHVQQLLDARDGQAALAVAVRWVKSHGKTAPQRDRCLYLIAQALVQTDDWVKAYFYLDELMDEYPSSPRFAAALEVQFHIAEGFLSGHKLRFLGLPVIPEQEDGLEMMFRLQQRSPGSPLAERALLRSADYYYASQDYDLAEDAYDFYARQYPRSDRMAAVKLRSAFAALAQFRGPRFDATPMVDARAKLADFAQAYPAQAADENVAGLLAAIDDELAYKLLITADYYRRTGATRGAVYTYRYLAQTYPKSRPAAEARARLAAMPARALADVPPQAGHTYAPPAVPVPRVPIP